MENQYPQRLLHGHFPWRYVSVEPLYHVPHWSELITEEPRSDTSVEEEDEDEDEDDEDEYGEDDDDDKATTMATTRSTAMTTASSLSRMRIRSRL